jgi:peptidoglycan/xylan/chitin deacetylase (PgdA/CDA1 family)
MRKRASAIRLLFEAALVATIILLLVRPPSPPAFWYESVVFGVPTEKKVAALTYDDGPSQQYTPELLDILDRYKVKATFFMIGKQIDALPDLAKDVARRGHVIANHTYSHPHNIELETEPQIISELEMCESTIERVTGQKAHLFRPPRGLVNGTVFMIAEEEGYPIILWTVSADHHDAPTPEAIAKRVAKRIRPGAIILAHDGTLYSRWKDVSATPLIIKELRKKGYSFVTIPELLRLRHTENLYLRFLEILNFYPRP